MSEAGWDGNGGMVRTGGSHEILIALSCEDGQQVEDVKEEVLVGFWHFANEGFVCSDCIVLIKRLFG